MNSTAKRSMAAVTAPFHVNVARPFNSAVNYRTMIPALFSLALGLLYAAGPAAAEPASLAGFLRQAEGINEWLISTRRTLHAHPELSYDEHNTSATIRRTLDELGIPYKCAVLQGASAHLRRQCSCTGTAGRGDHGSASNSQHAHALPMLSCCFCCVDA